KAADIDESLLRWKNLGDSLAVARTYLKKGDSALASQDSMGAQDAYEEALSVCAPRSEFRCMAEAANNSGYASFLLGDLAASSGRLWEAAGYWRRQSLPLLEGRTLNNLGLMSWQSGDFEQAVK